MSMSMGLPSAEGTCEVGDLCGCGIGGPLQVQEIWVGRQQGPLGPGCHVPVNESLDIC